MQEIASYKRRVFLKDHPVVTQRIVLSSAGTAQTLLAGTVIAAKTAAHAHAASATENTTMPEDKAPATNVIARAALRMETYFRPSACALLAFFTFLAITAPPMNYRGCPIR